MTYSQEELDQLLDNFRNETSTASQLIRLAQILSEVITNNTEDDDNKAIRVAAAIILRVIQLETGTIYNDRN